MSKTLFILKIREDYSADPSYTGSYQIATGMYNSAKFVVDTITNGGETAEITLLPDANAIDAAVLGYNADNVVIEGLWVTPAKFTELMALAHHAGRRWIVRIHSEIPFLSSEGIAMDWIKQYLLQGVVVAPNAPRIHQQLVVLARSLGLSTSQIETQVPLLPNCFPVEFDVPLPTRPDAPVLDIACFGAFRPLKNHLQQVFVAARFAESQGKGFRFHTNCRYDAGGVGPAKNVDDAVSGLGGTHVIHDWEDRTTFLQSLRDVDLLLQVSMSETFNYVAADAIAVGTPILVSDEITWAYPLYADPQNVDDCLAKLTVMWGNKPFFINKTRSRLTAFQNKSATTWLSFV